MGKKSSSKKLKKQAEVQEAQVEAQKHEEAKKNAFVFTKKRIATIILTVVALATLGFIAIYGWNELSRPKPLAQYLPKDRVTALIEIDTQWEKPEWQNFFTQFQKVDYLQKEYWIKQFEAYTQVNFTKQIQPWLNRRVGVAFFENGNPILFFETKNIEKSVNFFENFKLANVAEKIKNESFEGTDIYSFEIGSGIGMSFLGNYLVVAPDTKTMKEMVRIKNEKENLLSNDPEYKEIVSNLPRHAQAFAYMNPKLVFQKTIGEKLKTDSPFNILHPLIQGFQGQGWSANFEDGNLMIENFIGYEKTPVKFSKQYDAKLISFLPQDLDLFYGTSNLKSQFDQIAKLLTKPVVEAFVTGEISKWFGWNMDINLALDLFQEEYAIAKKGETWQVITRLEDPEEGEKEVQSLLSGFQKTRAVFEPVIEGEKITGNPAAIKPVTDTHRNFSIRGMEIEGKPWGIYYTVIGNTAIFGSTKASVQKSIDIWLDGEKSFEPDGFENIIGESDEVFHAKAEILKEWIPEFFDSTSIGWKYLENGIKGTVIIKP